MDIRKLQRAIVDGIEDVKGQNIVVFNTQHLSPLFERVIIASGTSNRQTKSLASSVREAVRAKGFPVLNVEGEENGEWIIVDCGAAVVHLMQLSIREYYRLEEIWGGKPVRVKLTVAQRGLVKASEPEDEDWDSDDDGDDDTPPSALVAPKAVAKAAVKKAAVKKATAPKAAVAKKVAVKKVAAKKVGVKKVAAKKAPSKKAEES
jgi:ribosome-associated protein